MMAAKDKKKAALYRITNLYMKSQGMPELDKYLENGEKIEEEEGEEEEDESKKKAKEKA